MARDYAAERRRRNERARRAGFESRDAVTRYVRQSKEWSSPVTHIEPWMYKVKGSDGEPLGAAGVAEAHRAAFRSTKGFAGKRKYKTGDKKGRLVGRPTKAIKRWYVDVAQVYTSKEWDTKYGRPVR